MCHQTVPLSSTHALNVGLDGPCSGRRRTDKEASLEEKLFEPESQ